MIITKSVMLIIVITILFTLFQIWLSKKEIVWKGMALPVIYWMIAAPYIRNSLFSEVYLMPDVYHAAVLFFPGIWLIMIFYIFYYYHKCRNVKAGEKP